jgi:hypothetical protein
MVTGEHPHLYLLSLHYKERRQLKLFSPNSGPPYPSRRIHPSGCVITTRWNDYKNRNLRSFSAKNELFLSHTPHLPTLHTRWAHPVLAAISYAHKINLACAPRASNFLTVRVCSTLASVHCIRPRSLTLRTTKAELLRSVLPPST